ncbi:elongation factor 1-gamma, putative [Theileria annulata]|uniref:Elongation factor 1-gamma, putative n=1 Tax=Theileria annulata TaxID=5874 RepID=Q4U9H7_THEAN|nr:elongation factor 1-gamma, putative [Theileria annulata]CAI76526.1 elongation factor 1-gamma, putative [Theileria annulata]|eukprot:XP_953151.1 elongation factor 1-gamma, putative [Theileria annulata]
MVRKVVGVDLEDYGTKSVLVTAAWANVNFDFEVAKGTCCASQAKKNAFSELKHAVTLVLDKDLGTFCGHVTVCRHLLDHVSKGTDEKSAFERSDTSSWVEFFYSRLDFETKLDKSSVVTRGSNSDLSKVVVSLNNYLATKTFLVAEKLSPADLVCAVSLDHLVHQKRLDAEYLEKELLHLARFLRTVKASDSFQKFLKMVENYKSTGRLDGKAPANNVEEKSEPAKKPKNPMDLLPPTSFVLDQWKKTYSNCKGDLYKEAMPWLWERFDPEGWSFYYMVYNKLEDECKSEVFTSNMLSGFLQRFETEFRHYSFGVLNVMGSSGNFDIKGVWLVRGTELPALMTEHPSYEFHTFRKLDVTKPQDKKLVEDYFCACDEIDGVPIADCKVWK